MTSCIFQIHLHDTRSFRIQAGIGKIESIFHIIEHSPAQNLLHLLQVGLTAGNEVMFQTTSQVKPVHVQRVGNELQSFRFPSQIAQDGGLELACLVVVPITHQRQIDMLQCQFPVSPDTVYLCHSQIAGILPGCIPGRFVKSIISLVITVLHFQATAQVVIWLPVVRIRIAFG